MERDVHKMTVSPFELKQIVLTKYIKNEHTVHDTAIKSLSCASAL